MGANMKRMMMLCSIGLLTSCHHGRLYTPTMAADPTVTGLEGIALINQLQNAYEIKKAEANDPCHSFQPSFQEKSSYPYRRYGETAKSTAQKFECLAFKTLSTDAPTAKVEVRNHIKAGFALSDLYCDVFFRRIALHYSDRKMARGVFNDVGAAVSAVLGLAKAGSAVTGGAGAGFALIDSSFRNYDETFLVTPDLPVLQRKVFDEQDKFSQEALKDANIPGDYFTANSIILRYANLCSFVGMKGLINASLSQTTSSDMIERVKKFKEDSQSIQQMFKSADDITNAAEADNAS